MRLSIGFVASMVLVGTISCSKEKDDKAVQPPQPEVASCKVLHMGGISPLDDSSATDSTTPVVACFESKSQLTVEWCEKMSTNFDTNKRVYELFKGKTSCPKESVVGKCVYEKNDKQEAVTIWYYTTEKLTTDFELVRKGCNYDGMYFSLQ